MTNIAPLNLPLVSASQAQKHVTVNESLTTLSAVVQLSVKDRDLTAPPGSPAEGDRYIPHATASGAWVGKEGKIAAYQSGAWVFYTPNTGWQTYVEDEDLILVYDAGWQSSLPSTLQNMTMLGVNTTADSTNKLAVASAAILFNNIGSDIQVKINKNATGDSGTFLFQKGFSGRAEFGLAGDDDFHFKTSPDGSTFTEAFVLDKTTGDTDIKQNLTVDKVLKLTTFLKLPAASSKTIASGVITATSSHHKVDTEAAAGTDDLDTINGGVEGYVILLEAANSGHSVVIKNGTGNIKTKSGSDVTIAAYNTNWKAFYDGFNWLEF